MKTWFFVTSNIPNDIPQVVQKIWRIYLSILAIFINFNQFFLFLTFSSYKETNDVSLLQMMSLFFHFQHTLNRLFKNYIKLYWHYISSSWNMKGGLTSKIPDLLGLNHGLLLQNVRKRENWIFQLLNYSINELFLKIRNAWCRCVIHGCLKNSIWLIFSYFSNFLLLY